MNVQCFGGTAQTSLGASLTRYFSLTGAEVNTSESAAAAPMASGGSFSALGCYVSANDHTGNSTLRLRINNTNATNTVVTITASTTGQFGDSTGSDAVVDNDLVNLQLVTGSGGTALVVETFWMTFAPTSGTVCPVAYLTALTLSGTADTFIPFGRANSYTTEVQAQHTVGGVFSFQNAAVNCSGNTRSDDTTFRIRVNGVNGNTAVTFTAATTGTIEDVTSSPDTTASGDEVNWMWDQAGGTGNFSLRVMKIEITGTNAFPVFMATSNITVSSATTNYWPISGRHHADTTRQNGEVKANAAYTWSQLHGYISAFTLNSGDFRVRPQINGSNGNMVIIFTATGFASDTSQSDSVASGDEIVYQVVTGGTSGSVSPKSFTSILSAPGAGGKTTKNTDPRPLGVFAGVSRRYGQ